MDRRDSLKTLAIGGLVAGGVLSACKTDIPEPKEQEKKPKIAIGRTEEERKRDEALMEEQFFLPEEMKTISALCALIIPADEVSTDATTAGVPEFIEFMAKDVPEWQVEERLRGGLAWLNREAFSRYERVFADLEP